MVCEDSAKRYVYPSGAERATSAVPTAPPAPLRFSITIGWPRPSATRFCIMRETMSRLPPGGNGTTQRIGLLGHSWAVAAEATKNNAKRMFFIFPLSFAHHAHKDVFDPGLPPPPLLEPDARPCQ